MSGMQFQAVIKHIFKSSLRAFLYVRSRPGLRAVIINYILPLAISPKKTYDVNFSFYLKKNLYPHCLVLNF